MDGNVLACDDFLQNYNLKVVVILNVISNLTFNSVAGILVACR